MFRRVEVPLMLERGALYPNAGVNASRAEEGGRYGEA
jgi:hypothetical protein